MKENELDKLRQEVRLLHNAIKNHLEKSHYELLREALYQSEKRMKRFYLYEGAICDPSANGEYEVHVRLSGVEFWISLDFDVGDWWVRAVPGNQRVKVLDVMKDIKILGWKVPE